ncbi:MAG: hypothetical protein QOJ40_716 [Verrucomicrobiota bacterium]
MKTSWKILIADLVLAGLVTLVLAEDKPAKSAATKASDAGISNLRSKKSTPPDFPIIGYIEKRDRTITIKAGPKGTLYSVRSADGKTMLENLSAEQLHAKAPELDEFIKSAVVGNSAPTADARVRVNKIDARY